MKQIKTISTIKIVLITMYMSLISKVKVCVSNKIQRDTEWKILDHNVTTTKIQICDSNIYTLNITDALCLYFSE